MPRSPGTLLLPALIAALALVGCDATLTTDPLQPVPRQVTPTDGGLNPPDPQPAPDPGNGGQGPGQGQSALRMWRVAAQDPMADNADAIVLLVPDGWNWSANVQWTPEWQRVAQLQTVVADPATGVTIEWLPIQDFIYFDPPAGFPPPPIGGNYQGKAYVPPIADPAQFVSSFWMPGSLARLQNATLTSVDEQQPVADEFLRGYGGPAQAAAYRLRYRYDQDGQPWDEDVYFALLFAQPGQLTTSWYVNFAHSVRGPAGTLDRDAGVISAVIASRITTPAWEGIYGVVVQLFVQGVQQQMADTQAFGQLLAQHRAESEAHQRQVVEERQASQDRIADMRGETLQNVQTMINPIENSLVQLPSGYSTYWVDRQGNYLFSDQPGFDPNQLPNGGGWSQLQPR